MKRIRKILKPVGLTLAIFMLMLSGPCQSALAAMIGTESVLDSDRADYAREYLKTFLTRDDVKTALISQGIDRLAIKFGAAVAGQFQGRKQRQCLLPATTRPTERRRYRYGVGLRSFSRITAATTLASTRSVIPIRKTPTSSAWIRMPFCLAPSGIQNTTTIPNRCWVAFGDGMPIGARDGKLTRNIFRSSKVDAET